MSSQLILGSQKPNLLALITSLPKKLEKGDSIRIAVAYISVFGYRQIQPFLINSLENGVSVELIVGLGQGNTQVLALEHMRKLMEDYPGNFVGKVVWRREIARNQFHPKLYIFTRKQGSHIIVGSSNLTRGGLRMNIEANTLITNQALTKKAIYFFRYIRNNSITLDQEIIDTYRGYCKKAQKVRKALGESNESEQLNTLLTNKRRLQRKGENALLYVVWNDQKFSRPPTKKLFRRYKGEIRYPHRDPWESDYIFDAYAYVDGDPHCYNRVKPGSLIFICSSENHMEKQMKVVGFLYVKRKGKNLLFQTSDNYFNDFFPYVVEADQSRSVLFRPYLILDYKLATRLSTFSKYSLDTKFSKGPRAGEKMPVSFRIWSAIRAVRGLNNEDALELLHEYLQLPGSRDRIKCKTVVNELQRRLN